MKHGITREKILGIIEKLLGEIDEEDVGISLLTTHYQNQEELHFFKDNDHAQVLHQLKHLVDDSIRHKKMLQTLVHLLEAKLPPETKRAT